MVERAERKRERQRRGRRDGWIDGQTDRPTESPSLSSMRASDPLIFSPSFPSSFSLSLAASPVAGRSFFLPVFARDRFPSVVSLLPHEDSRRERDATSWGIRRGFRHYTPTVHPCLFLSLIFCPTSSSLVDVVSLGTPTSSVSIFRTFPFIILVIYTLSKSSATRHFPTVASCRHLVDRPIILIERKRRLSFAGHIVRLFYL